MKPYYQDEWVTIYHGDCREILPTLEKVDLVLTDPPYNPGILKDIYHKRTRQPKTSMAPKRIYPDSWDSFDATEIIMDLTNCPMIVWGGNNFPLPPSLCWLVWDKLNGSNDFSDCELAWTNLPFQGIRIFRWLWSGAIMQQPETRLHPTMKPLALMKWCIKKADEADIILDPFMGSGTTLRAAKDLNRHCIGIEIEEKYCEIAAKRCSQSVFNFSEGE